MTTGSGLGDITAGIGCVVEVVGVDHVYDGFLFVTCKDIGIFVL